MSAPALGSAGANGNALQPGGAIPRVLGRLKVFPSFASFPLIELSGDDETVEAAYVMAGPHEISDIRIEGTRIDDIDGVQYLVNEGLTREPLSILNRYGLQRSPNFELQGHRLDTDDPTLLKHQSSLESDLPSWRVEVSALDPDEIWLQLTWPTGMTDSANNLKVGMPFRLRMREVGTTAWTNLPELVFAHKKTGAITKKIVLTWANPPSPIVDAPENYGAWESYHTVPTQTLVPVGAGGWSSHSSFVDAPLNYNRTKRVVRAYDGFTVHLDPAVFPRGKRWEVGIIRGCVFETAQLIRNSYFYNGTDVYSFFDYRIVAGEVKVPAYNIYTDTIVDRVVLSRFASVFNRQPLPLGGDAAIEVRAKNVQLAQLSCIAAAYVPDWNGAEWSGSVTSSNPATHLAHIMMGGLTEDPVDPSLVNMDEMVAFRQRAIDEGFEIAMAVDGQNWWEVMQGVASTGFGRVRAGTRFGVAFDRDSSAELAQHFTTRNASNFVFEKAFLPLEDAFRVKFRNRDLDWQDDERLVIRPGLELADVKRITRADAVGLDTEAAIDRRFTYDMRSQDLRDITMSFDVPPEGLVSQMGDVVALTHPMLSRHHRAARIAEIVTDGSGLVTGLVLDNRHDEQDADSLGLSADMASLDDVGGQGVRLAATIVRSDLTTITAEIAQTGEEKARVSFITPIAAAGIARQCQVVIGEFDMVTERMVIRSVRPTRRFKMRITAIPEAPELWS